MNTPYRYSVALGKISAGQTADFQFDILQLIACAMDSGDFDELIKVRVTDNPDLMDADIIAEQIANGDWDDQVSKRMQARR